MRMMASFIKDTHSFLDMNGWCVSTYRKSYVPLQGGVTPWPSRHRKDVALQGLSAQALHSLGEQILKRPAFGDQCPQPF